MPSPADDEQLVLRLVSTRDELAPLRNAERLQALDVRRNGRRIDVRLSADDGRAWLVVVWEVADAASAVESVTVYERPPAFPGRPGGLMIVLNGPSSVGKSSLMRAFADRVSTPYACLDEPVIGRVPLAFSAWPDTLGPAVDGVLAGLNAAARWGNQFIMSAAGISQARIRSALVDTATFFVGLHAPLGVLIERQLAQVDKFGRLAEESMGIHEGWKYDLEIDTHEHSTESAAELLDRHVRELD